MPRKSLRRKPGKIPPKSRICVLTEGRVTEVEYLREARERLGLPKELVIVRKARCTQAKGIVDEIVDAKRENERLAQRGRDALIQQWWGIVDTECQPGKLKSAIQKAKANDIWLAISDPCFEFWLRLHFGYTTASYGSVEKLLRDLRSKGHLPGYCEGSKHPDMGILYPHISDAVRNARKLRANHTKAGNGQPRTDCDLLVNALGAQTREDVPPFEVQPEDPGELSMYWT